MGETLKPCPFCGREGVARGRDIFSGGTHHWIECRRCKVDMGRFPTFEEALERWNRRAAPALSKEVRSALERTVILLELQAGPGSRYPLEDAATLRTFLSVSTEAP